MDVQMRYEACYVHVMQVLKFLINPGTVGGQAAAVEREARMSIADRSLARKVLLQVRFLAFKGIYNYVMCARG